MLSWEHKRSPRILALDARREQEEKNRTKGKEVCDPLPSKRAFGQESSKSKRRRKKVKTRPVQELVSQQVRKGSILETEEDGENAAENQAVDTSATAGILPDQSKLELLLGKLQKRDSHGFFANRVDPDEVEFYYDVITEPMDFGTISSKLQEGSYKALQEFERDVFLVVGNAMLFNASNTIYYRRAHTLKKLALKLFHALKTDPDNFETEESMKRPGPGRRTKAEVLLLNAISSGKRIGTETASKGCKGKGKSAYPEVDRRQTYRPWSSFLNDNESILSMFYNDSKSLEREEKNHAGYLGSLIQFAKNLGPTAQRVARSKAGICITEALRMADIASGQQLHAPKDQIPCAGTSRQNDIATASSLNVHEHSSGSRRFIDGYSGIGIDSLNGEKVSAAGMINGCYDLSKGAGHPCVGIDCASTSYETFRNPKGKNVSVGENSQASRIIETCGDFQRKNVIGTDSEVLGIKLGSPFPISSDGDGTIDFSSQCIRNSSLNRLFLSNMVGSALNVDKPVQTTDASSSQSRISRSVSLGYGGASSSSQQLHRAADGSSSIQPMGTMDSAIELEGQHAQIWAENGDHRYRDHLKQGDEVLDYSTLAELESQPNFNHRLQQKSRSEITNSSSQAGPSNQQGIAAEEEIHPRFKPLRVGSQPMVIDGFQQQSNSSDGWLQQISRSAGYNSSDQAEPSYQQNGAVTHTYGEGLYQIQGIADEGGSPRYLANSGQENRVADWLKPVEFRPQAMVDSCVQQQSKPLEGWHQQNARYDGTVLSGQAGASQQQGWVTNPTFGVGLYHVQGTGPQEGPSSECNLEHGRQLSNWNWLKPAELMSQPMVDSPFQMQSRPSEVGSDQVRTSRRQPQQGWTITRSDEQTTSASSAYDFEMCQTPRQREFRRGAPSDNVQKQPFTNVSLLKWLLEN